MIIDYRLQYLNDLFRIKLICFDQSRMLQLSEFVWTLRSSGLVVSNNCLLIDATDRSEINNDHNRQFFAYNTPSFFANTPFEITDTTIGVILRLSMEQIWSERNDNGIKHLPQTLIS